MNLPWVSSWEEEWKALELPGLLLHPEKMGFFLVQVFAVKKLDTSVAQLQNKEEFLSAVCTMAHLQHANITELVGYCAEHGQRLLVYQYVNRGTLNDALHTSEDSAKRISWNTRVKIALGAARALEYLHEVCLPAIVHRNFKSANILLDDEINPHLSDCGIAALTPIGVERQVHFNL
jgi:serine/threonine protein kinase